jgi:tRNA (cytidine/uridine-2'-O-)-methyltransferase
MGKGPREKREGWTVNSELEESVIERHIVLVAPEVHWNTGNIGRTCIGTNARLHLVRPLGFSLDGKQVKRAGLDYWPKVNLTVHDDFNDFLLRMKPEQGEVAVFSKSGGTSFWALQPRERLFLVFGSESRGLPEDILARYHDFSYHIPMTGDIRSLNLSTAVGIVLYESLRPFTVTKGFSRESESR